MLLYLLALLKCFKTLFVSSRSFLHCKLICNWFMCDTIVCGVSLFTKWSQAARPRVGGRVMKRTLIPNSLGTHDAPPQETQLRASIFRKYFNLLFAVEQPASRTAVRSTNRSDKSIDQLELIGFERLPANVWQKSGRLRSATFFR